ncbi:MAG TPA: DUF4198 domain-containing protein [Candidatus Sulfotelmatobacter sp.]|nr:DUF4198 domain-containing protein [Candidatus Sulfotelmatobacter sp.]
MPFAPARVLAAILAFAATFPAAAHDVWITTAGQGAALRAVVNFGHPDEREAPDPDKLIQLDVRAGAAPPRSLLGDLSPGFEQGYPVLLSQPLGLAPGLAVIAAVYDNGYWVKTPGGYRNTSRRLQPAAAESLWSVKFGKTLVETGPAHGDGYRRAIGQPLELVPLDDPFALKPGGMLHVRVDYNGSPLPGAKVDISDGITPVHEDKLPVFTADARGVAAVSIVKDGPQVLSVDHAVPSAQPDLAQNDVYSASLAFVLKPAARDR